MISKDKFDALQSHAGDKNLFRHLANAFGVFGISLGVEHLVLYQNTADRSSMTLMVICAASVGLGIVFLGISIAKGKKAEELRKQLFNDDKLIADVTTLLSNDGTLVSMDNLNPETTPVYQSKQGTSVRTPPRTRRD